MRKGNKEKNDRNKPNDRKIISEHGREIKRNETKRQRKNDKFEMKQRKDEKNNS
jgi:hypothetical protein